jgi:hypothetical protein
MHLSKMQGREQQQTAAVPAMQSFLLIAIIPSFQTGSLQFLPFLELGEKKRAGWRQVLRRSFRSDDVTGKMVVVECCLKRHVT